MAADHMTADSAPPTLSCALRSLRALSQAVVRRTHSGDWLRSGVGPLGPVAPQPVVGETFLAEFHVSVDFQQRRK
jgi:hypothetical protein